MTGIVIKNTGSWYTVITDEGQELDCKIKGNFRIRQSALRPTNPVAVGDRVTIAMGDDPNQPPFITDIHDRTNYVIRRSQNLSKQCHIIAANVDQAMLMVTTAQPQTATTFIDRFLASAEAYRVPVVIAFNKTDIVNGEEMERQQQLISLYSAIGYQTVAISAISKDTTQQLMPIIKGRITLLTGNSGVGKSTLLNNIIPGLNIKTAPVSTAHNTGQHTTTFSTMYRLSNQQNDTWLIDTPGIKGFRTLDFNMQEVSHYFPEIFRTAEKCRFSNCTHTLEPGCAVRLAVENNSIAQTRYTSYLSILNDNENPKYRLPF